MSRLGAAVRGRCFRVLAGALVVGVLLAAAGWRWAYFAWQVRTAQQALTAGELPRALEALNSAERLRPGQAEVLFLLARAHRRAGDLEEVPDLLARAEQAGWPSEDLRNQRYLAMVQSGAFHQAEPYLRDVLRRGCEDELAYEIYEAIAKGYLSTYRFQDALLCLDFFIKWRPDVVEPRLWRADVWKRLHRWEQARDEYRALLAVDPDHADGRAGLGDCLVNLNQIDRALREYERSLQLAPGRPDALLGAASCRRKLGELDRAEKDFRNLLESRLNNHERGEVLLQLGQTALDRRDVPGAIGWLEKAVEIDAYNSSIRHALGTAYARAGKTRDAEREFDRSKQYRTSMSRFAAITQQLYDDPRNADLRWEAGMILMELGQPREGAAWMSTALVFDPQHARTLETLAAHYARTDARELSARSAPFPPLEQN